jgi:hypothetical protein
MENEKDLSDSESDLEEDIVFGKLFDFSRLNIYCVDKHLNLETSLTVNFNFR